MINQHHIVVIDNDYGHINDVTLYSSHDTKEEATKALKAIQGACIKSHKERADREKENYQRYLKWATKAIVECPNKFGGFNWTKRPGDPTHLDNIQSIPYHTVKQCDGKTVVQSNNLIRVKGNEPLSLLEEITIPPEYYLEYHLVERQKHHGPVVIIGNTPPLQGRVQGS